MAVSCGLGHRRGSDPVLLWLWCRLETETQIKPLAWELPFALTLKKKKKKRGEEEFASFKIILQNTTFLGGETH